MSTSVSGEAAAGSRDSRRASRRLRQEFSACRLRFTWPGTTRALNDEQKLMAAAPFEASSEAVTAGKRLWNTKHPAYRAVTTLRSEITGFWKSATLPYPEPGLRLLPQREIEAFTARLETYRTRLRQAVDELAGHFEELKEQAQVKLGALYNPADYPDDIRPLIDVSWEFPSVDAPDYLLHLAPRVYQEQSARVAERFNDAVQMAEAAFREELSKLVSHLAERLSGTDDGQQRVFRDSAVENLQEFFRRFQSLSLCSNHELELLVHQCNQLLRGVRPQSLRDNDELRREVATQLAVVQSQLDQMVTNRPRRNIQRPR
jgi:hypothetical protein